MTALPPPAGVLTGQDPTAVMGRRIVAYLIDAIIASVVMAAVFWSISDTIPDTPFITCATDDAPTLCLEYGDTIRFADGDDATLVTVSGLGVWALLGIVIQGLTGGTPGKLMVGLRVIRRDDGRLAGIGPCAGRTVLWIVDAFPYFIPLVGFITGIVTKGHRRVGDMAAGTLVVRRDAVGTPPQVPGLTVGGPAAWSPPAPGDGQVFPTARGMAPPPAAAPLAPPVAIPPAAAAPPVAAPPPAATPPPPLPPPDNQPRWDPRHNAYVWFDSARGQWMVHDAAADQWRPL